jgi:hypothetical protein
MLSVCAGHRHLLREWSPHVVFWLTTLYGWLGVVGLILGVIPTPGAMLFPLVYWYVEGTFPTVYFAIWGVGPAGMAAAALGGLGSETQR